ncbi:MAG: hypothetical protein AAGA05_07430 [Pseudomonadota bacterium]
MSDSDSFINEVTEEVRRDRLYAMLRRYGWIAVLAIIAIVGGAAFSEYRKAQVRGTAESLGDSVIAALEQDESDARADALSAIETDNPGGQMVTRLLTAAAQAGSDQTDAAIAALDEAAVITDLPSIYGEIARFKALILQAETSTSDERRLGFEALAQPGSALRLLAQEQLALIDVETGETDAAVARLQDILVDAEAGPALQQRVTQLILALGGDPALRPDTDQG